MSTEMIANRIFKCTPVYRKQKDLPENQRGEIAVSVKILAIRLGIPEHLVQEVYKILLSQERVIKIMFTNRLGSVEMFCKKPSSEEESLVEI